MVALSGTPMTDAAATRDLLALTQWLSPAFPVGGFAFSHGLETMVATAAVTDRASFASWLDAVLRHGSGRSDAILLALAHREGHPVEELAAWAEALAAGRERWEETLAQGTAFLKATYALAGSAHGPLPLPIAVGLQARTLTLPTETVAALYLQGFAGNLATIAARLVPLGQTEAQAVLAGAADTLVAVAGQAAAAGLEDLATGAPAGDLASLAHETAPVRLFRT